MPLLLTGLQVLGIICFAAPLWPDYLYIGNGPLLGVLWLLLDDSAFFTYGKEYADKPKYYPAWVWNTNSEPTGGPQSTTQVRIGARTTSNAAYDSPVINVVVFGNQ